MIEKKPLVPERIRGIEGSFAFIEHRFLRDGFLQRLSHHELLVCFFLVLACDRQGMSYYGYEKICSQTIFDASTPPVKDDSALRYYPIALLSFE